MVCQAICVARQTGVDESDVAEAEVQRFHACHPRCLKHVPALSKVDAIAMIRVHIYIYII